MILTKEQIQKTITEYFSGKPVFKVWLFGSYARGEADDDSDLDVLVELDYNKNIGIDFFGWHQDLADATHKKVDVGSVGGVSKRLWPYIEKDMTLIYER
jgi:predicted nucleotidyltransferase